MTHIPPVISEKARHLLVWTAKSAYGIMAVDRGVPASAGPTAGREAGAVDDSLQGATFVKIWTYSERGDKVEVKVTVPEASVENEEWTAALRELVEKGMFETPEKRKWRSFRITDEGWRGSGVAWGKRRAWGEAEETASVGELVRM